LQTYEKATSNWSFVEQFKEDASFWKLFNKEKGSIEREYENVAEWNSWFIDVILIILITCLGLES